MTARAPHPANLDDLQRHGFLLSLGDASRAGQRGLESLMHRPKRGLAAAYLLVVTQSPRPAERVVKRLLATARARLRWLQQTFPVPLRRDGLAAGLLAERELFATSQVLQALLATAGQRGGRPGATATLLRRCRGLLLQWRDQLRAVSPGFVPATAVDLIAEATRHEGGRAAAWRQLTRLRDLPARAAALGVCHQVGGGQATGAAAVASDCPRLLRRDRKLDTSLFGPGGGGSAR